MIAWTTALTSFILFLFFLHADCCCKSFGRAFCCKAMLCCHSQHLCWIVIVCLQSNLLLATEQKTWKDTICCWNIQSPHPYCNFFLNCPGKVHQKIFWFYCERYTIMTIQQFIYCFEIYFQKILFIHSRSSSFGLYSHRLLLLFLFLFIISWCWIFNTPMSFKNKTNLIIF